MDQLAVTALSARRRCSAAPRSTISGWPGGNGRRAEDPDDDGDWDLWVVNLSGETNTFYRNLGGGEFRIVTDELRLGAVSLPYTGFGTGFFDYDNDSVSTSSSSTASQRLRRMEFHYAEPNLLLRGSPAGPSRTSRPRPDPSSPCSR